MWECKYSVEHAKQIVSTDGLGNEVVSHGEFYPVAAHGWTTAGKDASEDQMPYRVVYDAVLYLPLSLIHI